MAALSVTTVVLSLADGCPGLAFYVLEVIINTSMIMEVGIRFVALGKVRRFSRDKFALTLSILAILEIALQHRGSDSYGLLCHYSVISCFREMRDGQ
jgi:hypothetical protein